MRVLNIKILRSATERLRIRTVALVESSWLSLDQVYNMGCGGWEEEREEHLAKEKTERPRFVSHYSVTPSGLIRPPSSSVGHCN